MAGARIFHRPRNRWQRSLVQNVIDPFARAVYSRRITQIAFMKVDAVDDSCQIPPASSHEVVEGADAVSTRNQRMR